MKYQDLVSTISTLWTSTNGQIHVPLVLGKPGGGKSAMALDVARACGGIYNKDADDNVIIFTPSLRDPVDVLGTPRNNGTFTEWIPPSEFYRLSAALRQDQKCFLIVEEATDASMAMMNAMCRIVHDRFAGDLQLAHNLHIIMTGNRTEDKSGANRLSTKLGNRLLVLNYDENLQDWVDWAIDNLGDLDLGPILVQFIRFRSDLLSQFNPNRPFGINPTPRSWEKVAHIPASLPSAAFFEIAAGYVGEGAAAEFAGFRKIYESLVSFEDVVMNPKGTPIPQELSAQYATVGSLAHNVKPVNVERVAEYVDRMSKEFGVMFWQDTVRKTPAIKASKAFIKWATSHGNAVLN